jgi:RpiB/LacA/LacB family sugar-phosphate isomerase
MIIAIGSDHAGFVLKGSLVEFLKSQNVEVLDVGTDSETPVDYPDFAKAVALSILGKKAERGILICGSGVGASVAANKIPGIRAGLCHDTYSAHQGVEHDDMNILVMGSRIIGIEVAKELVKNFMSAVFSHEERHVRRLEKIVTLESQYLRKSE